MYAGQTMILIIAFGALITIGSSIRIIMKVKSEGGGWPEMKSPLYYAQSPVAIALVLAGVAKAILPPQHLSISGQINPAVSSASQIDQGYHCLFEMDGALRHPGIAEKIETFKTRFTSRDRFELQGYSISPVSQSGIAKGFHLYSIDYKHLHYKAGEKIPLPKRSTRTYWVDHDTCDAELRGDSNYGIFDPLSFINLNDWFNS